MQVKFWGTRGSLPTSQDSMAIKQKLLAALKIANGRNFQDDDEIKSFIDQELPFPVSHTWGGNTPCVEILDDKSSDYFICDAGSGARELAGYIMRNHPQGQPIVCHFLMSHLHWDHIMGFPFFTPVFIPGNEIHIYGCHDDLEKTFRRQNSGPNFPVPFDFLAADIHFHNLEPGKATDIAGKKVSALLQHHGDDSYGYRIERNDKVVVYSTDSEHKQDDAKSIQPILDLFYNADVVIFDAMYSLADSITCKQDWGHSSNIVGVDLCHMAKAKRLCLFHHEPINDDEANFQIYQETIRYEQLSRQDHELKIISAYDGLIVDL
jgi:phosphoribosyl 1,2-cyclic phosphodiesterase